MFKVKDEHKNTVIGFNNSGVPLGQRDDIGLLAGNMTRSSGLKKYFDDVPESDEELNKIYEEAKQTKVHKALLRKQQQIAPKQKQPAAKQVLDAKNAPNSNRGNVTENK